MVYLSSNNAKMHGFSPSSYCRKPRSRPLLFIIPKAPPSLTVSEVCLHPATERFVFPSARFYRDTNIPHTLSATFLPTAAFPASTPCLFVHGDALRSFCSPAENEYKAMP